MGRLSINISDETRDDLRSLAEERGTSVTDIVRRAVAVYALIDRETVQGGKRCQIVGMEGVVREVVLL